ncbi:hypothetical protein KXX52_009085, partial [Aspergillus fumigatus]
RGCRERGGGRQPLYQPLDDRRGGGQPALWWRGAVGHRAQGGRAALPLPLLRGAGGVGRYDLGRWQRHAVVAGRRRDL